MDFKKTKLFGVTFPLTRICLTISQMKRKETLAPEDEPEFKKPLQRTQGIDDATLKLMDDLPPVRNCRFVVINIRI